MENQITGVEVRGVNRSQLGACHILLHGNRDATWWGVEWQDGSETPTQECPYSDACKRQSLSVNC